MNTYPNIDMRKVSAAVARLDNKDRAIHTLHALNTNVPKAPKAPVDEHRRKVIKHRGETCVGGFYHPNFFHSI